MGLQQALGMRQQGVACRREPHRRAAARYQLHLQLVLKLFDVGRDIGLHRVQALGRRTKTAGAADGFKDAQRFELHVDHKTR